MSFIGKAVGGLVGDITGASEAASAGKRAGKIQQQAAMPDGPYQPEDLAYLTRLIVAENVSVYDAVERTNRRAQERQAQQVPQGTPEAMPGLAPPGMGAEAPMAPPAGPPDIGSLLAQLGGG